MPTIPSEVLEPLNRTIDMVGRKTLINDERILELRDAYNTAVTEVERHEITAKAERIASLSLRWQRIGSELAALRLQVNKIIEDDQ